jgi:hypothetical protein
MSAQKFRVNQDFMGKAPPALYESAKFIGRHFTLGVDLYRLAAV